MFTLFLGEDFLTYEYTGNLTCIMADNNNPRLEYDDASWKTIVNQKSRKRERLKVDTPRSSKAKMCSIPKKSQQKLFKARKGKRSQRKSSVA